MMSTNETFNGEEKDSCRKWYWYNNILTYVQWKRVSNNECVWMESENEIYTVNEGYKVLSNNRNVLSTQIFQEPMET